MFIGHLTKETTDIWRFIHDTTPWLDPGETVSLVSKSISLGTTGWSEAPFPPPGSPLPFDPSTLEFGEVTMDETGTQLIIFVEYGTPGNLYTCTFIVLGTSGRQITLELGVQVSGVPPQAPPPYAPLPQPPTTGLIRELVVATEGGSVAVLNNCSWLELIQTVPLNSYTTTMPVAPGDSQDMIIGSRGGITSWTLAPSPGQSIDALPTTFPAGTSVWFRWIAPMSLWARLL